MSYTMNLTTQDGKQFNFSCDTEQTVQEAAEAAGFFLPASCKMGSCGSCLAHCVEGDYQMEGYNPALLSIDANKTGEVLLCRTYPKSHLQITAPYESEQIHTQADKPRLAKIIELEKLAERTMRLVLQLTEDEENGLAFEFTPGQFVELEVEETGLQRAYSLANTPNWEGRLEFLIRLQPNGQFSTYLQSQAAIGDSINVYPASGTFGLQEQNLNPRCFVAGGTGLAPFLSILRRMAEWGEDYPTHLFLGVNNEKEIFCQQELEELQDVLPQFQIELCVWKPESNWQGFCGTPVDALKDYLEKTSILPDVFLCGPPMLVESATQVAIEKGVSTENIHCEKFV